VSKVGGFKGKEKGRGSPLPSHMKESDLPRCQCQRQRTKKKGKLEKQKKGGQGEKKKERRVSGPWGGGVGGENSVLFNGIGERSPIT